MLGALSDVEIDLVLRSEAIGRIGCHANGRTYVVPVTYAFDGECAYAHSAVGMKIEMMRANPEVCFEVDHLEDLGTWRSVIAWGTYEELAGDEAKEGMAFLLERLMPRMTSETARPSHGMGAAHAPGQPPVIFRIRLGERTGRFERRS